MIVKILSLLIPLILILYGAHMAFCDDYTHALILWGLSLVILLKLKGKNG